MEERVEANIVNKNVGAILLQGHVLTVTHYV